MCVATRLHALQNAFVNDPQTAICMPPGFTAKLTCKACIGSLQSAHNIHLAPYLNHKADPPSQAKRPKAHSKEKGSLGNDPQTGMRFGRRRHFHLGSSTFLSVNICYAKYRYILLDMLSKYLAEKIPTLGIEPGAFIPRSR